MSVPWNEDELTPRIDLLTADFTVDADTLPVAHPESFRSGDIVRIGKDDLEDTGELDDWGNPIMRARNEAIQILDATTMTIRRALGANPAQPKPQGERVMIIGTVRP